jgi:hypothetical protein
MSSLFCSGFLAPVRVVLTGQILPVTFPGTASGRWGARLLECSSAARAFIHITLSHASYRQRTCLIIHRLSRTPAAYHQSLSTKGSIFTLPESPGVESDTTG